MIDESRPFIDRFGSPEKTELHIGFMPLTDCASVVMASALGFDEKHGLKFVLRKEASWAGVRDKLVGGELAMAHALYGLVYGVHLGISGPRKEMAVLMTLAHNGQAITLSKALADRGAVNLASLARLMAEQPRNQGHGYTFAQTFPTGTHAMWLYYWLAAGGIDPLRGARIVTVPPPQMVASMRMGKVDGFCVGEPWNHRAAIDGIGITAATTPQVWPDHPEKVLGCTAAFAARHPNTARAAVMAVLEASRWIEASAANRRRMCETIATKAYVDTGVDAIDRRTHGHDQDGRGDHREPGHLKFFGDGAVNYPYLSDGMWFMTQFKRWGLLADHPDYLGVARSVQRLALYREAAQQLKVHLPAGAMRSSRLLDGVVWDGSEPARYADSFAIRAQPALAAA